MASYLGEGYTPGDGKFIEFAIAPTIKLENPVVSFESTGTDAVYNLEEVGTDGTINATVRVGTNAKVGDTLVVNGNSYAITFDILANGLVVAIAPSSQVQTSISNAQGSSSETITVVAPAADLIAPVAQVISQPVTADNIINAQESQQTIKLTGKVTGEFVAGDQVSLQINQKTYQAVINANGEFSADVPGSEIAATVDHM